MSAVNSTENQFLSFPIIVFNGLDRDLTLYAVNKVKSEQLN